MSIEKSIIWIKPDVFYKNKKRESGSELKVPLPENPKDFINEVKQLINSSWLTIIKEKKEILDKQTIKKHYEEHKWVYDENHWEYKLDFLIRYIGSWDMHFFLVSWESAIKKWREIISKIRNKYLKEPKKARYNMTHASWNKKEAKKEELLHFYLQKMKHSDINFHWFENREKELKKIYRYSNFNDVFYRSNVYIHSIRLFYLIKYHEKTIKNLFPNIDFEKVLITSLIHDDSEILIWDFQSWDRLSCGKKVIEELEMKEIKAIEKLSKKFPKKIGKYVYKDLLLDINNYKWLEAQIVKFFDHIDGFCEALHEYFAWNICIVTMYKNKYGKWILPFDYYNNLFSKAEEKYPLLANKFRKKYSNYTPFELDFDRIDFEWTVKNYSPHTKENIWKKYPYHLYNFWTDAILNSKENLIIKPLYEISQKRFILKN